MGRRFTAVLARLGTPTGDGRILSPGGISSRDLPLPLLWQRESGEGHSGSVVVGRFDTIDFHQDMITATGALLDDGEWSGVVELLENGVIGPSVDLDDMTYVVDDNDRVIITSARIAGATLVAIPAFADVSLTLAPVSAPDREMEPAAVPSGYYSLTPEDLAVFSAVDVSRETLPPLEWFAKPDWDRPTPLVVSDTGRVYGHIAQWGVCHIGLPGCVTPPTSNTGYAHFLTKSQPTEDGSVVPVGVLTAGGGHADAKLGLRPASEHYDDPEAAVAKVFAGEDEFGIWVAGWVLPYAKPERVAMLRDLDISGDWRQSGGNLEMIAACAVNTAGFPQRKVHFSLALGGQQTLIGAFKVKAPDDVSRETSQTDPGPVTDSARAAWARASWRGKVETMGCCGNKTSATLEYEVKTHDGKTKTVATLSEVRLTLAAGGGGTYRSVPKKMK